jgi:hypothetical protein
MRYIYKEHGHVTFADVATSALIPLHRLHKPGVVTKDGVDRPVTRPVATAAVLLDAADARPRHLCGRSPGERDQAGRPQPRRRNCSRRAGSPTILDPVDPIGEVFVIGEVEHNLPEG